MDYLGRENPPARWRVAGASGTPCQRRTTQQMETYSGGIATRSLLFLFFETAFTMMESKILTDCERSTGLQTLNDVACPRISEGRV